ncbi:MULTISPECIES: 3D-(3,5/4)-trihydroxycyclohexane-1,2-dione acylhydrolase (decyclizing) [Micromonospora]|uniref:3D-(3,5/4)-trihydroxycyclohexane-1,2-dione acylhydrolase (Decyclizing) n=1 Tax=Micromonospora solifontis TaxID=2487138 RepID=A0ABX9WKC3_9ACTN|nr:MULTISPECIES: 3D-(3,5/4)-trihydroxycyclohexane-1,2-dione acylhydrolase (decyclizing) [Micromonospora]NES14764.1 3D-(3,5/4)-trihydroxycyclohexane-1,2-dione acylhydrolase (decyclizing) [Micromonospora sp. PPF5-17B]NES35328.1 3D-(3,5/4)-trihydroxycyclohexane-1,2-dione acylhydrolase (decyclizing) [Micromonospora solifontis]NES56190.1 3D-(3,5/4)-trihydroxycyclohexane-1,2-dione acylhydrolase (decyclizing) [Micromonospora sp. PPF5-6]RNM00829.1 3D-(3,5/4)-trihydroxycyclohexane-1,2-dione acylhydrolas
MRMTVAQAVVAFLAEQETERDGVRQRLIAGCFGIFGHGNVAGLGQALLQAGARMPYFQARNEQAMVHTAAGYARTRLRASTYACTTSIGPGATNLVTGAALATVNRLPVLLLPGDVFATRVANPVLQELEDPRSLDVSVNDTLRPVSRYWDRIYRPEQLPAALLAAARVLTDPAETGAVTLALPQDVQAEVYDFPDELFAPRVWHIARPRPDRAALERAADLLRSARRPLIVAGGGVGYSGAAEALADFAAATGIPVAETQAGKGSLPHGHPCAAGPLGATGSTAANALAREADVVVGIGTRYSDFTTASRTIFADPDVRFVNLNVAAFDAAKLGGVALTGDAREGLRELARELDGWTLPSARRQRTADLVASWDAAVDAARAATGGPLTQAQVLGAVNDAARPSDVVVCAAGSMPGDLHRQWRAAGPGQYHVEYGYSCMGYEIAGGLGVRLAAPDAEVFVLVGDGSYLMMAQELATAVAEGVKLTVVLVDNRGYASIGALSEHVGAGRFGTAYRARDPESGLLDGPDLPVDLAANAASLGAQVLTAETLTELRAALAKAAAASATTVVYVRTPLTGDPGPSSDAWWDVPVAQAGSTPGLAAAQRAYAAGKATQRGHW